MQPQGDLSNLRPSLHGFLPFCCMIRWINGRCWWIPSILLHVCLSSSVQCWTDQSINQNVGWDLDILMAHIPPLHGFSPRSSLSTLFFWADRKKWNWWSYGYLSDVGISIRFLFQCSIDWNIGIGIWVALSGIIAYMLPRFRISFPQHVSFTLCCIDRKN
jgi:hypothetical protein